MIEAYESGDIYLAFGKQARVLPPWATDRRTACNEIGLRFVFWRHSTGQKSRSLSEQINQPDIVGRELLRLHHKVYRHFWDWSNNRVNRYLLSNEQRTVFGWRHVSGNSRRLIPSAISICKPTGRKCSAWPVAWAPKLGFRSVLQFMTRF